jgi:hypothetical protein
MYIARNPLPPTKSVAENVININELPKQDKDLQSQV